jgi:hypothetical protein
MLHVGIPVFVFPEETWLLLYMAFCEAVANLSHPNLNCLYSSSELGIWTIVEPMSIRLPIFVLE